MMIAPYQLVTYIKSDAVKTWSTSSPDCPATMADFTMRTNNCAVERQKRSVTAAKKIPWRSK
jgi:hypothetical protein